MPEERFKNMKCKVLSFNGLTRELDIDFQGYGIRLYHVKEIKDDYVVVKYRGKIGTPNFSCKV